MTTSKPSISLLMTVRNGERYLRDALQSVLAQTRPPDEVVVVDDGSEDGTLSVLREFAAAVTVVRQSARGFAAGLNTALEHSRHELVCFLDADDLLLPDAIERRLARLQEPDAPDGVSGLLQQFLSPELPPETVQVRFVAEPVRAALFGTALFRRDCFDRVGGLDEEVGHAPTIDWIARARLAGLTIAWLDHLVLRRRIHQTNMTRVGQEEHLQTLLAVARRQQQRRRQGG